MNTGSVTRSHSHQVTYLSPKSHNEFVGLLGSEIRQLIVDEIKSSGAYAAMADTTPDVSHLDQISVVIRYVDTEFQHRVFPYITCMGHKANLCVEQSCQASLLIDQFFTTLQETSTTCFGKLKDKIEKLQDGLIMKTLSRMRWIGRAE